MRALILAMVAAGFGCGPAPLEGANGLHLWVRNEGQMTRVFVVYDESAGCPRVSSTAVARLNDAALPLVWAGGTKTKFGGGDREISYCEQPSWGIDAAPVPRAREVVEVTDGKSSLSAVFDTPLPSFELLAPQDGVLPPAGSGQSVKVAVRASLTSDAVSRTSYDIRCDGITWTGVTVDRDRREYTSGTASPRRGTVHCLVQFNYSLAPTECSLKNCSLTREAANMFSATQPSQLLGFDLTVP